ncbi:MAG TPA: 4a-hydroxytetrahydrobiopterin dehydratase [Ktedonobacterales bacterium]|jgi:4a-hydroxytetrahydrobiopterin dehydratase|nr:4a-hydroxytetrahydrobiopterin dehydratase [Ktedonobacterales bacterium]
MPRLDDAAIARELATLHGWTYASGTLTRKIAFPSFPAGIAFVNRVAELAEQAGHHPDITINYSTVTLALSTHDAGGVTEKDLDLARRIDALAPGG